MDKRMFEHADEAKFWEIWVEGPKIYTRHRKLGASGQTKVKDGDAATVDKMIQEKVGGDLVLAAKKTLAHLESIELALRIDAAGIKKVSALANVKAIDPGRETEDFHFRYVATME